MRTRPICPGCARARNSRARNVNRREPGSGGQSALISIGLPPLCAWARPNWRRRRRAGSLFSIAMELEVFSPALPVVADLDVVPVGFRLYAGGRGGLPGRGPGRGNPANTAAVRRKSFLISRYREKRRSNSSRPTSDPWRWFHRPAARNPANAIGEIAKCGGPEQVRSRSRGYRRPRAHLPDRRRHRLIFPSAPDCVKGGCPGKATDMVMRLFAPDFPADLGLLASAIAVHFPRQRCSWDLFGSLPITPPSCPTTSDVPVLGGAEPAHPARGNAARTQGAARQLAGDPRRGAGAVRAGPDQGRRQIQRLGFQLVLPHRMENGFT